MKARRTRPVSRVLLLGLAASIAMLTATTLTACAPEPDRCLPAPLDVSSADVAPGESLTVRSAAAECDLGYENGASYSIAVVSSSGEQSDDVDVPVERDGSFSTEITVPESFPDGAASVVVSGSPYDECDEDSGSCAAYVVDITVSR